MTCTPCMPVYNSKGDTLEEKGNTRYLGVYISFADDWREQRQRSNESNAAFFKNIAALSPTVRQFKETCQAILSSQLNYGRIVMPSTPAQDFKVQEGLAEGLMKVLGLNPDGACGKTEALTVAREEYCLGAQVANPAEIGAIQDTVITFSSLETMDKRAAASLWVAMRHGLNRRGQVEHPKHYYTTITRLRNSRSQGRTLHSTEAAPV